MHVHTHKPILSADAHDVVGIVCVVMLEMLQLSMQNEGITAAATLSQ